ncbi:MAG: DUF6499 domain-containing protein [Calditrichia bacterium]
MDAIADWRNESAYPKAGQDVLLSRWHWEFLRRNREYQDDYTVFKLLTDTSEDIQRKQQLAKKYGLEGVMFDHKDPMHELFQSPRDPTKIRSILWQTDWVEDDEGELKEGHMDDFDYLDPKLRQHEYAVIFNLRNPVDKQLESARDLLCREHRQFEEKRGRTENYPLYLRLLDAEVDAASFDEIAEVIFPDVNIRIARKKIEEELKTAKRLRDVNYRYI